MPRPFWGAGLQGDESAREQRGSSPPILSCEVLPCRVLCMGMIGSLGRRASGSGIGWLLLTTAGIVALFLGLVSWAVSSPVGAAPDDDYHLGSIWCPRPLDQSGCEIVTEQNQVVSVVVPSAVAKSSACFAFKPARDASCTLDIAQRGPTQTQRFDAGGYPFGYYQFHHLFVGPDVHRSVVTMRIVNIVLGFGGLVAVGVLAPRRARPVLLVTAAAAWIPMGVYFVASNNPSSWAISGVLIYSSALVFSIQSRDRRRSALLGMAGFGAVLAMTSRADSAFYLFVVSLAIWFLVKPTKQTLAPLIVSGVSALLGIIVFLTSGQAGNLKSDGGWPTDSESSLAHIAFLNFRSVPDYIATFWGYGMGPGWVDIPLSSWSTLVMIFVAGGAFLLGARDMSWRKGFASVIILGALIGIPLVTMTIRRVYPLTYYQGRYMLPLLGAFLIVWLFGRGFRPVSVSLNQMLTVVVLAGVANAQALQRVVTRYAIGLDSGWPGGLDSPAWWPWSVSAKATIVGGGGCMLLGAAILAFVVHRSIVEADSHRGMSVASREALS